MMPSNGGLLRGSSVPLAMRITLIVRAGIFCFVAVCIPFVASAQAPDAHVNNGMTLQQVLEAAATNYPAIQGSAGARARGKGNRRSCKNSLSATCGRAVADQSRHRQQCLWSASAPGCYSFHIRPSAALRCLAQRMEQWRRRAFELAAIRFRRACSACECGSNGK